VVSRLRRPRRRGGRLPAYGVDAPVVVVGLVGGAVYLVAVTVVDAVLDPGLGSILGPALTALALLASAAVYLHTTLRGKFAVWAGLLDGLGLRGDERVLDAGCGRGAVLVAAARRLPRGRVVGVDLWRSRDQSGNAPDRTRANAEAAGVADRVEIRTGDVTALPFGDGEFDLVLSSLVIHNLRPAERRTAAVDEAYRVMRPGGRLVLVDILHTDRYAGRLSELGATGVTVTRLGPRLWFGSPWIAGRAVSAARPPG
jgi:arsenite methyltransferase